MANFYANYPPSSVGSASVFTVEGEGTPGVPTGGLLTVQGDPAGEPIPITGSISATNPSVGPTAASVPAEATYMGINSGGNLVGLTGSASGANVLINASLPAGSNIIGSVSIDQTTPGTTNGVEIVAALPAGANTIGAVTQASGPWTVTGSGTAGSAAAGVVSIQGIASMTPVQVDYSGSGTGSVNVAQFGGNNVVTGTGTGGNGIPRVTVSSDSTLGLVAGSAIVGKVGIDQTTPGTTNGVQATSGTTCAWQAEGSIAFGSITNSYQTVFTPASNTKILYMRNNTNASISVSMDAGSTLNFVLDAGDQVATDLVANGLRCTTANIQIKYTVGAPTSGSFRVNGVS